MVSAGVRRPGVNPASASATVRVVKNSRPAGARRSGSVAVLLAGQAQHAHHRAQCHLAEVDERIPQLEETMRRTSICGLGQVALGPVMSVLRLTGQENHHGT